MRQRAELARRASAEVARLASQDVVAVAVTFVDTAGVTRVKGVPLAAFERAAVWGVGATPVFDAFGSDDSIADTPVANPAGDLRLMPDLDRLVGLAGQPGWAWAPADRWTQDGRPHPGCARLLAVRMVDRLAEAGFRARAAFEVEWVVFPHDGLHADGGPTPGIPGPAYGMTRLIAASDYTAELLRALDAQGVRVLQLHPEYAPGQLELSVAAQSPVDAADTAVLVRSTIRAVSARHGLAVSFAPSVRAGGVGNGGHLHLSISSIGARDGGEERNLFSGGDRRFGLTEQAESFTSGILARLPALLAVGAPSVASYLRLVPSRWAGAYACWGLENREAALRLVTGSVGEQHEAANLEVKCVDQSANPYLLVASVLAAGLAGLAEHATLPEPVRVNPAVLAEPQRRAAGAVRLPDTLGAAVDAFAADPVLGEAFGPQLRETLLAVRRAELDRFAGHTPEQVVAATLWQY